MSLKLLTVLSGVTGLSSVAVTPTINSTIVSNQVVSNNLEVNPINAQINRSPYDENSFALNYTETLTPFHTTSISLTSAWIRAKSLQEKGESNGWRKWSYYGASLFAEAKGTNGVVDVEIYISLPSASSKLSNFLWNLNEVAHGAPIPSNNIGSFKTRVIMPEPFLNIQLYYVNLRGKEVFLAQSNPVSSKALGTILNFTATLKTMYYYNKTYKK